MNLLNTCISTVLGSSRVALLIFSILFAWSLPHSAHSQITASATVSPNPLMVGQSAEYTISFSNAPGLPNLLKPRVDGLQFSDSVAASDYTSMVNGSFTREWRMTWTFSPSREGQFVIPGRTVQMNSESVTIPPAAFDVVPQDEESRSRALLKLEVPNGPYYVGQALEARLTLLVRADLNLTNVSFPQRNGEAFLNTEFNTEPQRGRLRVDGRVYNAFVWDFIITPIKSGENPLSFAQSVAIQLPARNNRMQGIFNFNMGRSESLFLETDALTPEVRSLPSESQPESFNGAIGRFSLVTEASATNLKVGEPLTLVLKLSGKGNFDRISAPELPDSDQWKVYPPKAEFIPLESSQIQGTKSFEYILIPQSQEPTLLPNVPYSYFDPTEATYHELVADPVPVSIEPGAAKQSPAVFAPNLSNVEDDTIPEVLLSIRPSIGTMVSSVPLWQQRGFLQTHLAMAIVFGLGAFLLRRRKALKENTHLARRHAGSRKLRKALRDAENAAKAGQADAFFVAARIAIQECAAQFGPPVEARTLVSSDCLHRLSQAQIPDNCLQTCEKLLDAADALHFAGHPSSQDDLNAHCKGLLFVTSTIVKIKK